MEQISSDGMLKGIFLLILAVSGNFVAETLGCKTRKFLTENMFAKHAVILLILYFSIGFTSGDTPTYPFTNLKAAMYIYILFILFTKMNMMFTTIVFTLLTIAYINYTFINYYETVTPKETVKIEHHRNVQNLLYKIIIGMILVGFVLYYRKQYAAYSKTWSTTNFLFGVNKCKSLD